MDRVVIPLVNPDIGVIERQNVNNAITSGFIGTAGYGIELAERKLREITGRKHAICTSSGTAALTAALLACNYVKAGVLCPKMTFYGVHNAIELADSHSCQLDSDRATWQVSADEWERGMLRHSPGCFLAAPCYGHLSGVPAAERIAKNYLRVMIEDASQSFWGVINGRKAGTFGKASIVSFNVNKIATAGGGGCVLTDNEKFAAEIRRLIRHGVRSSDYKQVGGFNGGMTNLHAAVLCAQLDRAEEMLERRRKIMDRYKDAASKWVLPTTVEGEIPAPWLFAGIPPDLKKAIRKAEAAGVETKPTYDKRGLVFPLSSTLTSHEVDRICKVLEC